MMYKDILFVLLVSLCGICNADAANKGTHTDPSISSITSYQYNGISKIVLEKNMVKGVNTLTQSMINQANTIYVIQYDYVLGETITVPSGCVFEFDGGSLRGGQIIGNNTQINYSVGYNIFNDCDISNFNIPYFDVRWFGAVSDYDIITGKGTNSAFAFQRAFNQAKNSIGTYVYVCGKYRIATQVDVYGDFLLKGENALTNNIFSHSFTDVAKSEGNSIIGVAHGITAFNIIGTERTTMKAYANLKISTIDLEGFIAIEGRLGDYTRTSTFMKYNATGAPSRPGRIEKVGVNCFNYAFKFTNDGKKRANTIYGTLSFNSVVAKFNNYVIYATVPTDHEITLSKVSITNSELSDNIVEVIHIEGLYSPLFVHNTNLEGSPKVLYVTINNNIYPTITVSHCYSEGDLKNKSLFEIHAKTNATFKLVGNVIMNTNYDVVLENTTFIEENNYIDLNNKIRVIGNCLFEDYDNLRYCKNLEEAEKITIKKCDKRAYELKPGQYEFRFHKSFDYKRMYSVLPNNEWGYKADINNKGAVCSSAVSVSKGDIVYILLYTSLLNARNVLLVEDENTQKAISDIISINPGDTYQLLRFKCTKSAKHMSPMIQSLGIGDQVGFAYAMVNPSLKQLSELKIQTQKYFAVDKECMNVEQGKNIGLTIFDTKLNCLSTWNGEDWIDAVRAQTY